MPFDEACSTLQDLGTRLEDPYFFPADFSLSSGYAVLAKASLSAFRNSLLVRAQDYPLSALTAVPTCELIDAVQAPGLARQPIYYLFHLPFSGSTLLTRHMEATSVVIRDPSCLYALFAASPGGDPLPDNIAALRAATLRLLARPFPEGPTLVRTAGSFPEMICPLGSSETFGAAIYLYTGPAEFTAQVLKFPKRRRDLRVLMRYSREDYAITRTGRGVRDLSDGALAGLLWIYTAKTILRRAEAAPGRLWSLTSETVMADPEAAAARISAALDFAYLATPAATRESIAGQHAKTGVAYDRAAQQAEKEAAHVAYAAEIDLALETIGALDGDGSCLRALERLGVPA
jgi:hypothetical protein